MLDTTSEQPIPLVQAARLIPPARQGKKTHLSTLLRWILHGARNPAGEVIHLEAVRIGNRWMTSKEALQRFAERLTPRIDVSAPSVPRTPAKRRRDSERAERELGKIGI